MTMTIEIFIVSFFIKFRSQRLSCRHGQATILTKINQVFSAKTVYLNDVAPLQ